MERKINQVRPHGGVDIDPTVDTLVWTQSVVPAGWETANTWSLVAFKDKIFICPYLFSADYGVLGNSVGWGMVSSDGGETFVASNLPARTQRNGLRFYYDEVAGVIRTELPDKSRLKSTDGLDWVADDIVYTLDGEVHDDMIDIYSSGNGLYLHLAYGYELPPPKIYDSINGRDWFSQKPLPVIKDKPSDFCDIYTPVWVEGMHKWVSSYYLVDETWSDMRGSGYISSADGKNWDFHTIFNHGDDIRSTYCNVPEGYPLLVPIYSNSSSAASCLQTFDLENFTPSGFNTVEGDYTSYPVCLPIGWWQSTAKGAYSIANDSRGFFTFGQLPFAAGASGTNWENNFVHQVGKKIFVAAFKGNFFHADLY